MNIMNKIFGFLFGFIPGNSLSIREAPIFSPTCHAKKKKEKENKQTNKVTDELVEVQDFRKITHQFLGIYKTCLKSIS